MEKFIRSVAQFIDNRKMKNLYGTHLDMSTRYFNIVLTLLIVFPLITAFIVYFLSWSYLLPAILIGTSIFYLIIFILANKSKRYNVYMCVILYMLNFVVLPIIFLLGGGIERGIWLYFMMGLFLTFFFFKGKLLVVTAILQSFYYFGLIFLEYRFPIFLHNFCQKFGLNLFPMPKSFLLIVNFFIVTFCVGIIVKSIFVSYIDVHRTELKLVDKLEQQTIRDPLTGTYNRRHLYYYLENLIKSTEKDDIPFSIIMYDIDKFKVLNDTYGHLVGDEVLCGVSKLLMSDLREYDIVARYGGEEFVIVLPGAKEASAIKRANQIRENIANFNFNDEITKPVTISGGVAFFESGMTASKIIKIADNNLYKAKDAGRNKIICAEYSASNDADLNNSSDAIDNSKSKNQHKDTKVIMCD